MAGGMFLEKIRSEGLSHLSYLIGHGSRAAVVDPRRDCRVYVETAHRKGAHIEYIFETHRNEDYVIGSVALAEMTGAKIYHGRSPDFQYGRATKEGDVFKLGDLRLRVLETPGHTFESISIAVSDSGFGEHPVAVFTGDALFVGDVGRTDFFPDQAEEVAGLLYESIFGKILPLGDQAILCPAHGAGSVCGDSMAEREFSTLGMERLTNPVLQVKSKKEFVKAKLAERHYVPPYFRRMEQLNSDGSALSVNQLHSPKPMTVSAFEKNVEDGAVLLDVRSPEAVGGALIPRSLGIPIEMLSAFAGWFLPYDKKILLVVQGYEDVEIAFSYLIRMGYDNVTGFLDNGLNAWEAAGKPYETIPSVHTSEIVRRITENETFFLLDVRTESEFRGAGLPGAGHIYLGDLRKSLDRVPRDIPVVTFCGSGLRAVTAATILKMEGYDHVENCLGSMAACAAIGCPIVKGEG